MILQLTFQEGIDKMPFPQQTPRLFTKENIEALTRGQIGCYGLYREGRWIYIGKGDIRQRLLDHLSGDNPCINHQRPTHWVDVVTANCDEVEKRLIVECQPTCNLRVG